jgi:hypothetical protein
LSREEEKEVQLVKLEEKKKFMGLMTDLGMIDQEKSLEMR